MATPRRAAIAAAAAMTITLLAGACTTSPDSPVEGAGDNGRSTSPELAGGEENEQGYVVVPPGSKAAIVGSSSSVEEVTQFKVEFVEVDPECADHHSRPEKGRTLLVTFRIVTGTDDRISSRLGGVFVPRAFSELTSGGVTVPAERGFCTESGWSLPGRYAPNSEYIGTIELVVPEASGTLLMDNLENSAGGGWEWSYDVPGR